MEKNTFSYGYAYIFSRFTYIQRNSAHAMQLWHFYVTCIFSVSAKTSYSVNHVSTSLSLFLGLSFLIINVKEHHYGFWCIFLIAFSAFWNFYVAAALLLEKTMKTSSTSRVCVSFSISLSMDVWVWYLYLPICFVLSFSLWIHYRIGKMTTFLVIVIKLSMKIKDSDSVMYDCRYCHVNTTILQPQY